MTGIAVIAVFVVAFAAISRRLETTIISPPMLFTAFGVLVSGAGLDLIDLNLDEGAIHTLAEATLLLVLFTDAARIDLRRLRKQYLLPLRLLAVSLPLTIALGAVAGRLIFGGLLWTEAALLAAVLAPTDAALGQAVVSSPRVPVRIRQTLNVESGLNDGIALPAVTLLIALAGVGEATRTAGYWAGFAGTQIGFGIVVGIVLGLAGGWVVDRTSHIGWMNGTFQQLATLAVAVAAFAVSESIGGNGFIAAFVAGLAFGRVARERCEAVYDFAEDEGQLLTLLVFLAFGAAILGPALGSLTWQIALYAVLSLTVIRMLPTALAVLGAGLRLDTIAFLGWFGPRGLASILFGLLVVEGSGIEVAEELFTVVTWTVALSILAHGMSALPAANAYGDRISAMDDDMPENQPAEDLPTRAPLHG